MATPRSSRAKGRELVRPLLFFAVAVGAVLAIIVPGLTRLVPPCAFRELTGLYCPGCGTGRAMTALVHGDLATALKMNAFAVIVVGPVLLGVTRDALEALGLPVWSRIGWRPMWGWLFLGFVLAFWIARNIPAWPLTVLAPG